MTEKPTTCEDCGAKAGAESKVEPGTVVSIERIAGRWLCSDCADALAFALEN